MELLGLCSRRTPRPETFLAKALGPVLVRQSLTTLSLFLIRFSFKVTLPLPLTVAALRDIDYHGRGASLKEIFSTLWINL